MFTKLQYYGRGLVKILLDQDDRANKFCSIICVLLDHMIGVRNDPGGTIFRRQPSGQIETAADVNRSLNYQYVSIKFTKTIFAVMSHLFIRM